MNITNNQSCALAALSTILLCNQVCAQSDAANTGTQLSAPYYVKSADLLGAKVYLSSTAEMAKGEKPIGEVKDLILDSGSGVGHGTFAVLSDGELYTIGQDHLHGISCLRWDESTKKFTVDSSNSMRGVAEANGDRTEKKVVAARPETETALRTPSRLVMYSGIKGVKVIPQGSQDAFGKLDDLWLDVRHGCVGFLAVSSGGVLGVGDTTRLIPWQATSLEKSADRKENQLHVRASKETLEAAPKVEAKTDVNEPNLRANAYKHFNCEETAVKDDRGHIKNEKEKVKDKEEGKR